MVPANRGRGATPRPLEKREDDMTVGDLKRYLEDISDNAEIQIEDNHDYLAVNECYYDATLGSYILTTGRY
jgi:hypothetical protein